MLLLSPLINPLFWEKSTFLDYICDLSLLLKMSLAWKALSFGSEKLHSCLSSSSLESIFETCSIISDTYANNYFADRSFTNLDKYEYVDSAAAQSAKLGCNMSLPVSKEHIDYVVSLYSCFNDNTLGKLWTSSMPYLFPFIVEYRYCCCPCFVSFFLCTVLHVIHTYTTRIFSSWRWKNMSGKDKWAPI